MKEDQPHLDIILRDQAQLEELYRLASVYRTTPGMFLLACKHIAQKAYLHELQEAINDVFFEFHPNEILNTHYTLLIETEDHPNKVGDLLQHTFPYREGESYWGVNEEGKIESTMRNASISAEQLDWLLLHKEVKNWDIVRRMTSQSF